VPPTGQVFVGLGSNLGERIANVEAAVDRLACEPGLRLIARSSLYQSAPVGVLDQPWFVNAVAQVESALDPERLLQALQSIERDLGRRPTRRWGERVIDLDLLLYDDLKLASETLTVPHPRLWQRLFVLRPLAELAPGLRGPDGRTIETVIAELERVQTVELLPDRT
jgi:2-amino-4-hydroxy-6-hydroxymethyldihydropteridine diphosphokinase